MTDILELAKQSGFLPEYISLRENRFSKLEALLREKFIAELGEPVAWGNFNCSGVISNNHKLYLQEFYPKHDVSNTIPLYTLPKDKDELK